MRRPSPSPRTPLQRLPAPLNVALAAGLAAPVAAQVPIVDVTFDDTTPPSAQDLVIVRERAYGAGGVNLTAAGILGTHDFVQSIYVRANHGTVGFNHVTRGRLVPPAGATVIGVIFEESDLGGAEVTHINLNDKTVEGLRHQEIGAFSVQYHPEAAPGPHDSLYLFDQFVDRAFVARFKRVAHFADVARL